MASENQMPSGGGIIRETQYLVSSGDGTPFFVQIEPEGMMYEFPRTSECC